MWASTGLRAERCLLVGVFSWFLYAEVHARGLVLAVCVPISAQLPGCGRLYAVDSVSTGIIEIFVLSFSPVIIGPGKIGT